MNGRFRQGIASAAVFIAILVALVSIDPRVQDRFTSLFSAGDGLSPWGDRMGDLVGALSTALRTQSIENAPFLVFAAGSLLLFLFMVKS